MILWIETLNGRAYINQKFQHCWTSAMIVFFLKIRNDWPSCFQQLPAVSNSSWTYYRGTAPDKWPLQITWPSVVPNFIFAFRRPLKIVLLPHLSLVGPNNSKCQLQTNKNIQNWPCTQLGYHVLLKLTEICPEKKESKCNDAGLNIWIKFQIQEK